MYEIWVKRNYKLTKIEETDEIKNINARSRRKHTQVCDIC